MASNPRSTSFAHKVRSILEAKKLSIAALASMSELDSSLLSKILSDSESTRREPRLEHLFAIARALEMTPRELAAGTPADALLNEWVPRAALDAESQTRTAAQARASNLETELTASRAEAAALKSELSFLTRHHTEVQHRQQAKLAELRVALRTSEAKSAAALVERDHAVQARAALELELTRAKGATSAALFTGLGVAAFALTGNGRKRRRGS